MPKTLVSTSAAPDRKGYPYDGNSIVADVGSLFYVLDSAFDVLREMDYSRPDGSRNTELDRLSGLIRAALDLTAFIERRATEGVDKSLLAPE